MERVLPPSTSFMNRYYTAIASGIGARPPWFSIPCWLAKGVAYFLEWFWRLMGFTERPLLTLFVLGITALVYLIMA